MKVIALHRKFLILIPILIVALLYMALFMHGPEVIKVGILHSRTGSLALSEEPLVDAVILAIEKINAQGGLLGKKVVPVIADGKSNEQAFALLAERLITEDKVAVIFGCWSSSARKSVKPVVEKFNSLLFYPVQYEGVEYSPNIIYTGAALNQHILPSITWAMNNLGTSFFLVGSDYIYNYVANAVVKDVIVNIGGTVVGEEYIALGSQDVGPIIEAIEKAKPTVIFNSISGDTNIAFYKDLNVKFHKKIPVISTGITESEVAVIGIPNIEGMYQVRNYFESVQNGISKEFVDSIKDKYGKQISVTGPMEAAYFGVQIWGESVKKANSIEIASVLEQLYTITYKAPQGIVRVDKDTHHTWQGARVGKVQVNGQFQVVWESKNPLKPEPYPSDWFITGFFKDVARKSKQDWDKFVYSFYTAWGNQWTRT